MATIADNASSPEYSLVFSERSQRSGCKFRHLKPLLIALLAGALLAVGLFSASGRAGVGIVWHKDHQAPFVRLNREHLRFLKLEDGDCGQHGMLPITDQDGCRTAGVSMGVNNLHVFGTSLVAGKEEQFCYYFQKDASIPATLWMGTKDLFTGSFQLLCMPQESEAATHAAALALTPGVLGRRAPMSWVGCFRAAARTQSDASAKMSTPQSVSRLQIADSNTGQCLKLCLGKGYSIMSLQDEGACACLTGLPETELIVPDSSCGRVCKGEATLSPARYCGGDGTQAVFRINASTAVERDPVEGDAWAAGVQYTVLKGVSYAPVPLKSRKEVASGKAFPNDDFMASNTAVLWGPSGRHDLKIMRRLGANAVRLYGNDPSLEHKEFMDEAMRQELHVVAGISDYPYLQMTGNCLTTGLNCYSQVRNAYKENLLRGFAQPTTKRYHPALRTVILINEPDLKLLPSMSPNRFSKAVVSAFDAVLDAEKEVGVVGPRPNFTATFSFGVCSACGKYGARPGLGQMMKLREAMKNPNTVGYAAKNDLWHAYRTRFENSVNTANTADSFKALFLDTYNEIMKGTPVFVGEYHSPMAKNEQKDLYDIIRLAEDSSNLLTGVSFFEFQVRYDKGGEEMTFGMFGLGEENIASFSVGMNEKYAAWCLMPNLPPQRVNKCGRMEKDVRYVVQDIWSYNLSEPIKSPELCCSRCLETPSCRSWTWEANPLPPAVGGCTPARCWLHGGLPLRREQTWGHGTISGLPPVGRVPGTSANGRSRALLSEMLIPTHVAKAFGGPGLDYSELCPASAVLRMHLTPAQAICQ